MVPGYNIANGKWTLEDAGSEDYERNVQDAVGSQLTQHKSVMTSDKCISLASAAIEQSDFEVKESV